MTTGSARSARAGPWSSWARMTDRSIPDLTLTGMRMILSIVILPAQKSNIGRLREPVGIDPSLLREGTGSPQAAVSLRLWGLRSSPAEGGDGLDLAKLAF